MLLIWRRGGLNEVENSFVKSLGTKIEENQTPCHPKLKALEEFERGHRKEELQVWPRPEKIPKVVGKKQGDGTQRWQPGTE